MIITGAGGFRQHILARRLQGDEDADGSIVAVHHTAQIPNIAAFDFAALDLHQDLFGFVRRLVGGEQAVSHEQLTA